MDEDFTPTYLYIKQHSITKKLYFGKTIQNPETYYGSGTVWQRHLTKHGKLYVINLWYCLFYTKESIKEFALNFSLSQNIIESKLWANLKNEDGLDGGNQTEESKEKIRKTLTGTSHSNDRVLKNSESHKGLPSPRKGKINSESSNELNRLAKLGNTFRLGSTHSAESNELNRVAHLGKNHSEESKHKISLGLIDHECSDETKSKISKSNSGKVRTDEMKRNSSEARKGKGLGPRKTLICPHCGKEGGDSQMKRYHFDNCKMSMVLK